MFGRLIFKSLLVICAVTMLVGSIARAESSDGLSLEQIRDLQSSTLKNLSDKDYSNDQKYDLILQQKYVAETSLRQLILDNKVDLADIAKPHSSLARALETADVLVILSQLKLENGKFTEDSCIEARGMLNISAIRPQEENSGLNRKQQNLATLVAKLCQ